MTSTMLIYLQSSETAVWKSLCPKSICTLEFRLRCSDLMYNTLLAAMQWQLDGANPELVAARSAHGAIQTDQGAIQQ